MNALVEQEQHQAQSTVDLKELLSSMACIQVSRCLDRALGHLVIAQGQPVPKAWERWVNEALLECELEDEPIITR